LRCEEASIQSELSEISFLDTLSFCEGDVFFVILIVLVEPIFVTFLISKQLDEYLLAVKEWVFSISVYFYVDSIDVYLLECVHF